ncbi:hypothetical protein [Gaoshiqia sediminis]|uniref:Uncharacterized protein n=1 Tax=Gaoshiqia sediminis TaxID=2986998 RepID=A0AA42C736_9BACT|nr:hypothetical protein [Gaoshiqia sediminis]MCW0483184.1 hypothetical protein [Gaoshiqia sediminis]
MNTLSAYILKAMRKSYKNIWDRIELPKPDCIQEPNAAAKVIFDLLTSDKPCMIARFGSTELTCLANYSGIYRTHQNIFGFIKGEKPPWWWDPKIISQMQQWSGFFPPEVHKIEQFCELMIQDIPLVDVLGSWLHEEHLFAEELLSAEKIALLFFDPFWAIHPWTKALEGKKVLVVHPFTETIQQQYKKRELIFENNLLPEFELKTIKAVQSIAGATTSFADWFEALDYMKKQIEETDFDICLIGAGAYGFPLAAHVKRLGKKAFHIGGSLQLLFGIKGKRWESDYHNVYNYPSLFNAHWVRPKEEEKPTNAQIVEGACYW